MGKKRQGFTEDQFDAFKEIINIGMGRAANSLSEMLDTYIGIEAPNLHFWEYEDLVGRFEDGDQKSLVRLSFSGPMFGEATLVFDSKSAINLVNQLVFDDEGWDAIKTGTLTEVGNIVLNGVMGILGNFIETRVIYDVPTFEETINAESFKRNRMEWQNALVTEIHFRINDVDINGEVYLFFTTQTVERLKELLDKLIEVEDVA